MSDQRAGGETVQGQLAARPLPATAPGLAGLPRILQRTWTILLVAYHAMMEYRAELLLWMLAGSLPFIMMGIWVQAAGSGHFSQTPVEFARYFISVFVVRQLTVVWVIYNFETDVVQGKLSSRLLQPLDPAWRYLSEHVAERGARLPFMIPLLALFFWLYPEAWFVPTAAQVLMALSACALSFLLRFLLQYTLALLAFWTERAVALEELFMLIFLFCSGVVAPLEVFPEWAQRLLPWTPFPYLIYFPARLLSGGSVDYATGMGIMLAWSAGIFVLNRLLWRRGLREYSGMGG